jgi:hypothetical protein
MEADLEERVASQAILSAIDEKKPGPYIVFRPSLILAMAMSTLR